jgi:hypothetical protein
LPAHAAVDAANNLAAPTSKAVHFKPLINAVLRRIATRRRSGAGLDAPRLNTPDWLWERWRRNMARTPAPSRGAHKRSAAGYHPEKFRAMFPESTALFGAVAPLESGRPHRGVAGLCGRRLVGAGRWRQLCRCCCWAMSGAKK